MDSTEDESALLAATVDRFFSNQTPRARGPGGYATPDAAVWKGMAELGILAAPFDPEHGGLGLGPGAVAVVMRSLGRALVVEPYLSTVVMAGGLIARGGSDALKAEALEKIAEGRLQAAVAFAEPNSRYNLSYVETSASAAPSGYRLRGHKSVVLGAPDADLLLVTARTSGEAQSPDGVSIFAVPRDAQGVVVTNFLTIDGRPAGDVQFDNVLVDAAALLGDVDRGGRLIERAIDEAAVAVCSEAIGAMERLVAMTLEHCKTRVVFDQPLSKLQVVQHRLVDMHVAYEYAAAITQAAVEGLDDPKRRALLASAAMATVAAEGEFIGQWAVQLHGAAGTTEDLDVGRYYKRLLAANMYFGGAEHHRRRYFNLRSRAALQEAM